MQIKREKYLQELINACGNRMIKVVTGMRRCGKSYLLFTIFHDYLVENGTPEDHIIMVDLENRRNMALRDPDVLLNHIFDRIVDKEHYYVLLDEVQLVSEFEDVLNSFLKEDNVDVFVTGSNARFLSKDVVTEFRGRGDEIRIHPLSFREFAEHKQSYSDVMLREYMLYGGLPQVVLENDPARKVAYLKQQFTHTYLRDIKDRYNIQNDSDLLELITIISSCIGSLTNPPKIANTFKTVKQSNISVDTIRQYLEYMEDAFMIERSIRYDIKGRKYIDSPYKYYFEDLGLRNVRVGFRQTELPHIMENLLYNELREAGFTVDVGQVYSEHKNADGKRQRSTLEVDFVCNRGYNRIYVQSAFAMDTDEKRNQEFASLRKLNDGFRKLVIVYGLQPTYMNDDGLFIVNLIDFLMNPAKFIGE